MSLPLLNLDDKSFKSFMDEARRLIPVYNPQWTNLNPSDPGIMLVELFAWMMESMLFRVNQIPLANQKRFLKLLGLPDKDLANITENNLDEYIVKAINNNSTIRAVTDNDYRTLVLELLSLYELDGKVHVLNNVNLSRFGIYNEVVAETKEGHTSLILIPDIRISTLPIVEEKLVIETRSEYPKELCISMGELDPYFEEKAKTNKFESLLKSFLLSDPDEKKTDTFFGYAVAVKYNYPDKSYLLIGAPNKVIQTTAGDDVNAVDSHHFGKVFLYPLDKDGMPEKNEQNMILKHEFWASEEESILHGAGPWFGAAVSINKNGDFIIGSEKTIEHHGIVYIFSPRNEGEWDCQEIKNTGNAFIGDRLGAAVCMQEDYAFAGAPGTAVEVIAGNDTTPTMGAGAGVVYVYKKQADENWEILKDPLQPLNPNANALFGSGIIAFDNYLLISAPGEKIDKCENAGAVYLFEGDGNGQWVEKNKFVRPLARQNAFFGNAISMNERYIMIATGDTENMVYTFRKQNAGAADDVWEAIDSLTHSGHDIYKFGKKLCTDKRTSIISIESHKEHDLAISSGIKVCRNNNLQDWPEIDTLTTSSYAMQRQMNSCALDNNVAVAGFPFEKTMPGCIIYRFPIQLAVDDFMPSDELIKEAGLALDEKRIITSRVFIRGPIFKIIQLELTVVPEPGVKEATIRDNIKNSLFNFYDPVHGGSDKEGYPIGRTVYPSELIERVEAVKEVDFLDKYTIKVLNDTKGIFEEADGLIPVERYELVRLDNTIIINISQA